MKKTKIIALNINCKSSHIMNEGSFLNSKNKYYQLRCSLDSEYAMEKTKESRYKFLVDWGVL
ncbi:MAG: hypothetical protein EOM55_02085 [Clostridia bacterium]|nr:hypothetical protein [Clostridia bacterium]